MADTELPTLDEVVDGFATAGYSPADQAGALLKWRDAARGVAEKSFADAPNDFFTTGKNIDTAVNQKVDDLRNQAIYGIGVKNFGGDNQQFSDFITAYKQDPQAAAQINPDAASQIGQVIQNPSFRAPKSSNQFAPLVGETGQELGVFQAQPGVDGNLDLLVNIHPPATGDTQGNRMMEVAAGQEPGSFTQGAEPMAQGILKVHRVTDQELADEQQKAADAAKIANDRRDVRKESFDSELGSFAGDAQDSIAAKDALRAQQLAGPNGRLILQKEQVDKAFNASPLAAKAGQWGILEDAQRSVANMALNLQYAVANTFDDDKNKAEIKQTIDALPDLLPGTTRPTGAAQLGRGTAEFGATLPMIVNPAGVAILAASTYGGSVKGAEDAADAADRSAAELQEKNPEMADQFRTMANQMRRDSKVYGALSAATIAGAGKLIPEAKTLLGNVARSGAEFGGINAVQGQVLDPAFVGKRANPIDILEGIAVGGITGAAHRLATGKPPEAQSTSSASAQAVPESNAIPLTPPSAPADEILVPGTQKPTETNAGASTPQSATLTPAPVVQGQQPTPAPEGTPSVTAATPEIKATADSIQPVITAKNIAASTGDAEAAKVLQQVEAGKREKLAAQTAAALTETQPVEPNAQANINPNEPDETNVNPDEVNPSVQPAPVESSETTGVSPTDFKPGDQYQTDDGTIYKFKGLEKDGYYVFERPNGSERAMRLPQFEYELQHGGTRVEPSTIPSNATPEEQIQNSLREQSQGGTQSGQTQETGAGDSVLNPAGVPTEEKPQEVTPPGPTESQPSQGQSTSQGDQGNTGGSSAGSSGAPPSTPDANRKPSINPDEEIRLTHADEDARRAALGLPEVPKGGQATDAQLREQALQRLNAGEANDVLDKITRSTQPVSDADHALMVAYAGSLEARAKEIDAKISDPNTNHADLQELGAERDQIQAKREQIAIEGARGGSRTGAALRARQLAINRNEIPTLPQLIADLTKEKSPNYDEPLTPEERQRAVDLHAAVAATDAAEKALHEQGSLNAETEANKKLLEDTQKELAQTKEELAKALNAPAKGQERPRFTKRVVDSISVKADAARERLKSRGITFNSGVDPTALPDYAIIMAEYIAKGVDATAEMISKFGKTIAGSLPDIEKMARDLLAGEIRLKTVDELKGQFRADRQADPERAIGKNFVTELAKAHIRSSLEAGTQLGRTELNQRILSDVKEFAPDMTLQQVRDLRTGYGQQSIPSDDPTDVRLRDLNRQDQLVSSLERAEKNLAPLKSGPQRDKASAEVRDLQKQLNDEMAKRGIETISPETQLASRREGIRTRLTNEIEDLQRQIDGKTKARPANAPFEYDKELEDLARHRDNLKQIVNSMPENVEASQKEKDDAAVQAAQDAEKEWNRRANELDFGKSTLPPAERVQRVKDARQKADEARARYQDLKKAENAHEPATYFNDISNKVDASEKRIKELEGKLARGDTSVDQGEEKPSHPLLDERRARVEELNKQLAEKRRESERPEREAQKAQNDLDDAEARVIQLEQKLDYGDLSKKPVERKAVSDELAATREQIKGLNKEVAKARSEADRPRREAEKAARDLKDAKDAVAALEKKLATGDLTIRREPARTVPAELAAERQKLKDLNKQLAAARKVTVLPHVKALEQFKARTKKQLADIRMRRINQNYEPQKRSATQLRLDAEGEQLAAQKRHELHAIDVEKERYRLSRRLGYEKFFDHAMGVTRGGKLTRILTDIKLIMYSIYHLGSAPFREAAGGISSKLPGLGKSQIESQFSLKALGKFYSGFFGKGFKDALEAFSPVAHIVTGGRTGDLLRRSDMKNILSENDVVREGADLEPHFYDIPQILHEVIKSPLRRAAFEYSLQKQAEYREKHGLDSTSKEARAEMIHAAGQEAQRKILMGDNAATDLINRGLARLEQADETGHVPQHLKVAEFFARSIAQFNRVAANHFVELFNTVLGAPLGLGRYANALRKGAESISPEDASAFLRQIKQGSIGAAFLLLGYTNPQMFGGLGHKKNEDDLGFAEMKMGGVKIPRVVSMANPLLLAAHVGATITRLANSKLRKSDNETRGIAGGLEGAVQGVAETGPLVSEIPRLAHALEPGGLERWTKDWLHSNLEPGLIQEISEFFDRQKGGALNLLDPNNKTISRKAANLLDELKIGIPGLRNTVPQKTRR